MKVKTRLLALLLVALTVASMIPTVLADNATAKYTVNHYWQNVDDDNYALYESQELAGEISAEVGTGLARTYDGFYALPYLAETQIAADGSTVVDIYYNRNYYLLSFDLDGGYGTEPVYARYGAPISTPATPERAGYTFAGWNEAVPKTMPAANTTRKAMWTAPGEVAVNLIFWYENANDSNYTYVGSATATTTYSNGKTVTPSEFKTVSFTGRDNYHFTFNSSRNTAVALNADGSTIVNIYFTRNTYRLIFFNCREHTTNEDTDSCYPGRTGALNYINNNNLTDCVDKTYSSGSQKWGISIYTRKWQQDVSKLWHDGIAGRSNTRRWMPYEVTGVSGKLIYNGKLNVSMMHVMPDADIVFRFLTEGETECTMYYWVTPVAGETITGTTKSDGGTTYVLRDKYTTMMGGITENEEYVDIEGFSKVYTWQQLADKGYRTSGNGKATAHMFYRRLSYPLAYISNGSTVTTKTVEFEGVLNGASKTNQNVKPPYPADWEEGAYEFAGWYTSQNCVDNTGVRWNSDRMPVGGMAVYAKWVPVTHTIKTYVTEGGALLGTYTAEHGKTVTANIPEPTNGAYKFVGWFYRENGEEKAYDFDNMPVTKDLEIYAKWTSDTPVEYKVFFKCENADGTVIAVAEPTTGATLAGMTKTLEAKLGDQLYEGFGGIYTLADGQDPTADLQVVFDESKNTYTFWYKEADVTITYVPVGPEGVDFGSVSPTSEQVKVFSGDAAGSTPTAEDGFKFVGWFKDEACETPVDASWVDSDNKIKPEKTKNYAETTEQKGYETVTYYAKFEYDITDLVITKAISNADDADQVFLFRITGPNLGDNGIVVSITGDSSVTICGLKVGSEYTVEELNWAWRYKPAAASATITLESKDNALTFTNTLNQSYWLGGDDFVENVFGAASAAAQPAN